MKKNIIILSIFLCILQNLLYIFSPKISQDSPLKNWCEELDLKNFTDVDAWINDVKQKRKVLIINILKYKLCLFLF